MRWVLLLVLLVACVPKMCPEGFVSAQVNGSRACISSLSYCVSDEQCTSARYDCSRPCLDLPVNSLFVSKAQEKAQACDRSKVRCKQVPFVDNRCVSNQCNSIPHAAEELIPQPMYGAVVPGKVVCYDTQGFDSIVRLNVSNNFSAPLQQLEAYVNMSLRNGSVVIAQVDLLNRTLLPNESVMIAQRISNATPKEIYLFAVRPIEGRGAAFGVKNQDIVASAQVPLCVTKDS